MLRAAPAPDSFPSNNARKRWEAKVFRAPQEMRRIAKEVRDCGVEAQAAFAVLLASHEPRFLRRWAAFDILELFSAGPDAEASAIHAIEEEPREKYDQEWIRLWHISHGSRDDIVAAVSRLVTSLPRCPWLGLKALRLIRIVHPITAKEVEPYLTGDPELVDAWIYCAAAQRDHLGWYGDARRPPNADGELIAERARAAAVWMAGYFELLGGNL